MKNNAPARNSAVGSTKVVKNNPLGALGGPWGALGALGGPWGALGPLKYNIFLSIGVPIELPFPPMLALSWAAVL